MVYGHFIKDTGEETYRTAITGHKGFPDIVAVRDGVLQFCELKFNTGLVSPEQQEWLDSLRRVKYVQTHLWRPEDYDRDDGETILRILR